MFATLMALVGAILARSSGMPAQQPALGSDRLLEVARPLADALPEGGLRRGSVVKVSGAAGSTSLFLALVAGVLSRGSWAGVAGIPALGLECAGGLGVALERLVALPSPGRRWAEVVAAMLDAFELVVACPPQHCRPADARRLAARARERRSVLVVTDPPALGDSSPTRRWPETVDLRVEVIGAEWTGLHAGYGALAGRQVTLRSSGRGAAARERQAQLWLPGPHGSLGIVHDGPGAATQPATQGP